MPYEGICSASKLNIPSYTNKDLTNLLVDLYRIGAIKIDLKVGFELHQHQHDPAAPKPLIYVELATQERGGVLTAEHVEKIAYLFYVLMRHDLHTFKALAPVPHGAVPFALVLARHIERLEGRKVPVLLLDKYTVDGKRYIGKVTNPEVAPQGASVLLLEDVVTRGDSLLGAAQSVNDAGFVSDTAYSFLLREGGTRIWLGLFHGVCLNNIFELKPTVSLLQEAGCFDTATAHAILCTL